MMLLKTSLLRIILATIAFGSAAAGGAHATMPPHGGRLPEPVLQGFEQGLFALPERPAGLATSAVQTVWRVPVILVGYPDYPLVYGKADVDRSLFDTTQSTATGSVFDYYRWVSGRRLTVVGEVVATITLPNERAFYGANSYGLSSTSTPSNAYGALRDALQLMHTTVDWLRYDLDRDGYVDMVWLMHAGQGGETTDDRNALWSITSRAGAWRLGEPFTTSTPIPGTTGRYVRIDRFSVVPELSGLRPNELAEIGVFCHEFGHALGLPDLYDTSALGGAANSGPGNWSLMATGAFGSNGVSPEYPSHLGAWPMQFLGWDRTLRPSRDTTLTLRPIFESGDVVEVSFEGQEEAEHFLIENRRRDVFDRTLPSQGLIIYHVNDAIIGARLPGNTVNVGPVPGLVLIEADGDGDLMSGRNHGDGSDPFPGSLGRTSIDDHTTPDLRSFGGAVTQLAIREIARSGDAMSFDLQVQAPGWGPIRDFTGSTYQPLPSYSPARTGGVSEDGTGYVVRSELRDGHPQVILHRGGLDWSESFQVSASTGAALDPTVALLPGGDLMVVWSDTRDGRSRLFCRSRVRGSWQAERLLVDLPGNCGVPAVATDRRGLINLVFQHTFQDQPEVMFMRFTYLSPFGLPRAVTAPGSYPTSPTVAVAPNGMAYVLWIARPTAPREIQRIWFSRYLPDSGMTAPLPLTLSPVDPQTALSAATDPDGALHTVWLGSGPGSYELHYQRRLGYEAPWPRDTVIERQGTLFQSPVLSIDPQGGVHLVYEELQANRVIARYKRWTAENGWDYRSTNVSDGQGDNAAQPIALPRSPGEVSVAFSSYTPNGARFMVRDRSLGGPVITAVPAPETAPVAALAAGPNPLLPGQALELRWAGPSLPAPQVDVFDLSGRRVATAPLENTGAAWRARFEPWALRTLAAGMYFARVRGASAPAAAWVLLR